MATFYINNKGWNIFKNKNSKIGFFNVGNTLVKAESKSKDGQKKLKMNTN